MARACASPRRLRHWQVAGCFPTRWPCGRHHGMTRLLLNGWWDGRARPWLAAWAKPVISGISCIGDSPNLAARVVGPPEEREHYSLSSWPIRAWVVGRRSGGLAVVGTRRPVAGGECRFQQLWPGHEVAVRPADRKTILHPRVGRLLRTARPCSWSTSVSSCWCSSLWAFAEEVSPNAAHCSVAPGGSAAPVNRGYGCRCAFTPTIKSWPRRRHSRSPSYRFAAGTEASRGGGVERVGVGAAASVRFSGTGDGFVKIGLSCRTRGPRRCGVPQSRGQDRPRRGGRIGGSRRHGGREPGGPVWA
ncbi:hypothetical protein SAMN04489713_13331 [Actinomadura madurae]|uniref:Uncharacterized protein n=1 Tax=Actinomadura madurae TaxID=1993 RepID=A0A1I5YK49_9ACTN|nr:hypothetical protein SAMN04489713_13331 [Actinomadura madurae]